MSPRAHARARASTRAPRAQTHARPCADTRAGIDTRERAHRHARIRAHRRARAHRNHVHLLLELYEGGDLFDRYARVRASRGVLWAKGHSPQPLKEPSTHPSPES
jgi:hypothetical protein